MLLILKRQAEGEEGSEHGSDAAADQSKQPELGWNTSDTHFVPYHSAILNGCSRLRYHVVVMIATSEFVGMVELAVVRRTY